jgi:hypothetical protein
MRRAQRSSVIISRVGEKVPCSVSHLADDPGFLLCAGPSARQRPHAVASGFIGSLCEGDSSFETTLTGPSGEFSVRVPRDDGYVLTAHHGRWARS